MYSRGRGGFGSSMGRGIGNYGSNDGGWGNEGRGATEQSSGNGTDFSMHVPNNKVGRIIGKGGSKVRELQEQSGCVIQITDGDYDGERKIELKGSYKSQEMAKKLIEELTTEDNYRGQDGDRYQRNDRNRSWDDRDRSFGGGRGYGEGNMDSMNSGECVMHVPNNKVGRIIGKGGSKIRELQEQSGCRIQISDGSYGDQRQIELRGNNQAQETAKRLIEELIQDYYRRSDGSAGYSQGKGRSSDDRDWDGFSHGGGASTRMEVPSNKLGKIIGKGGSKIKELQRESGAQIKILNDEESMYMTPVELRGSGEQCEIAKRLIDELTEEEPVMY